MAGALFMLGEIRAIFMHFQEVTQFGKQNQGHYR